MIASEFRALKRGDVIVRIRDNARRVVVGQYTSHVIAENQDGEHVAIICCQSDKYVLTSER